MFPLLGQAISFIYVLIYTDLFPYFLLADLLPIMWPNLLNCDNFKLSNTLLVKNHPSFYHYTIKHVKYHASTSN